MGRNTSSSTIPSTPGRRRITLYEHYYKLDIFIAIKTKYCNTNYIVV